MHYINISGYQFITLNNLVDLQISIKSFCLSLGLKGTILLGQEGINSFLSGTRDQIDAFYAKLPEFGFTIYYKESVSSHSPFHKMIVKIKREIVTLGCFEIDPIEDPAPRITPQQFHDWLNDNKSFIILDTRNDYEIRIGKFKDSIDLGIRKFRDFPAAIEKLPQEYRTLPIVTVCTGGIRCEKAAPFMVRQGFKEIYQLEGGILKYLEEYGNSHFEGECFVFDKRIAIDDNLEETATLQCIACRQPITLEEQCSDHFEPGVSCPACISK